MSQIYYFDIYYMNINRFQFRAIFTKKPYNGGVVDNMVYFNIDGTEHNYILCSRSYLEGKYILMQNSTLKDAQGIYIFDGDIISCDLNSHKQVFEVVFMKGMFAAKIAHNTIMSLTTLLKKANVIIIGNKYQNPEKLPLQ